MPFVPLLRPQLVNRLPTPVNFREQVALELDSFPESPTSALWTAVGCDAFTTTFPLWHKGVLGAELLQNGAVRFGSEDESYQRVRAYLQGLKPASDREGAVKLGSDLEAVVKQKIQNIIQNAKGDRFSLVGMIVKLNPRFCVTTSTG